MSKSNTAVAFNASDYAQSDPYFDAGHYKKTITKVSLNKDSEPVVTLRTDESFDGRRINSYYTVNFFFGPMRSDASQKMWGKKFVDLISACGLAPSAIKDLSKDIQQLVSHQITCEYQHSEEKPLPNFYPAGKYNPAWVSKAKVKKTWVTPALTKVVAFKPEDHVTVSPDAIDFDKDIPF